MKILVTGAAGFIGYNLVEKLKNSEDEVVGLDNINEYYDIRVKYGRLENLGIHMNDIIYGKTIQSKLHKNFTFIKLNIEDKNELSNFFNNEKFDSVFHLAAQAGVRYSLSNPDEYIQSNIVGFLNILECCRHNKIKHLVYASSSSVYGLNEQLPFSTEDNVDHPISLYAASKKSNELMAHTYSHLFNLPTTGLRFFTVYGPWGRPDMALFIFTKSIIEETPIKVYNNGYMLRDFTYIDDIVEALLRVINKVPEGNPDWNGLHPNPNESKAPYKIYNIGNNNPVKLLDFIAQIEKKVGKIAIKEFLPLQLGDVPSTFADVNDLENDLNFRPNTSIEEGIDKFVNWYISFFNKSI